MMPRILHVIPAVASRYGGPSAAVVGLCRALNLLGVETLIATTDADGATRLPVERGRVTTFSNVRAIFFGRHLGEGFKWSPGLSRWLHREARRFDAVHVHAVFSHSSIAAGRACRDAGIPYIVRPLGTLDPWSLQRRPRRKALLRRLGAGQLLSGAACMHYTSDDEKALAESAVPGLPRGVVMPLGVDDSLFTSPSADDINPYVLSLSRLDAKKGLDLLIAAFGRLPDTAAFARWRLVIAGDGDHAFVSNLKILASNAAADGRIQFTGWVTGSEKVALLRGASLFVSPSHQENFGIAVAEALASGVPVVVTPGVNLSSTIRADSAGWVVGRDSDLLAETIRAAISNPTDRAERGRHARRLAERFRWSAVAAEAVDLYTSLVPPHAHATEVIASV